MSEAARWIAEMDRLEAADSFGDAEWEAAAANAYDALTSGQKEVLRQLLFDGPVWDGDIASKAARGDLFDLKLAVRCCFKGQQGHSAASYLAFSIYRAYERAQLEKFGIAR
jgi:hypothetical protein